MSRTNSGAEEDVYRELIKAARDMRTLTYGKVGKAVGLHHRTQLPDRLGVIFERCRDLGLPPLTAIVVRGNSGRPGLWFWNQYRTPDEHRETVWRGLVLLVYASKWPDELPEIGGEP